MTRTLAEMTLEELWQLFPISLVNHNPQWGKWANEEIGLLSELLSDYSPIISHIGSTAIPGILAKPIIDILVETDFENKNTIRETMEHNGYICMSESPARMSFNKGYTPEGYAERVFHIHFHAIGDNQEITFRNYLCQNLNASKEYEALKIALLNKFGNDRDGYTMAKSDFIRKILSHIQSTSNSQI